MGKIHLESELYYFGIHFKITKHLKGEREAGGVAGSWLCGDGWVDNTRIEKT